MTTNPLKTKPAALLLGLTLAFTAVSMSPTASAVCTAPDHVGPVTYSIGCSEGCYVDASLLPPKTCVGLVREVLDLLP